MGAGLVSKSQVLLIAIGGQFPGFVRPGWERRVFTVGQEADWDGWREREREREGHRTCTAIVGQEGRGERPGPGPVVVDHNVTQDALYGLASVLV